MAGRTAVGFLYKHPGRMAALVLAGTNGGAVDEETRLIQAELRSRPAPDGEFAIRALSAGFTESRPEMAFLYRQILRFNPARPENFLEPPQSGLQSGTISNTADALIDQTVGSYKIKSMLARGGMGAVYLAEQSNPRRDVALKIMHHGAWSALAEKRFDVGLER